jgi:hypothetical protein
VSTQDPDWRSEKYVGKYLEDQRAAVRYQDAAKRIVEMGWRGEYLIFVADPSGHFLPIDRTMIQSEAFQGMISKPGAPNREQIYFVPHGHGAAHAEKTSAAQSIGHVSDVPVEGPGQRPAASPTLAQQETPREARRRKKREMYDTWHRLAVEHCRADDGERRTREQISRKIANDDRAADPVNRKHPSHATVKKRLNTDYPEWAENSWAERAGSKNLPGSSN